MVRLFILLVFIVIWTFVLYYYNGLPDASILIPLVVSKSVNLKAKYQDSMKSREWPHIAIAHAHRITIKLELAKRSKNPTGTK